MAGVEDMKGMAGKTGKTGMAGETDKTDKTGKTGMMNGVRKEIVITAWYSIVMFSLAVETIK